MPSSATDNAMRDTWTALLAIYDVRERDRVIRDAAKHITRREIARACGLSYSQVCRILQEAPKP